MVKKKWKRKSNLLADFLQACQFLHINTKKCLEITPLPICLSYTRNLILHESKKLHIPF